jgi:hypothetical protein
MRRPYDSGIGGSLAVAVARVNKLLRAWRPYFAYGYHAVAFRDVNHFIRARFGRYLRHRSQRRARPFRRGETLYAGLARYGFQPLAVRAPLSSLRVPVATCVGEPDAGNLHVRFDEGEGIQPPSLLDRLRGDVVVVVVGG